MLNAADKQAFTALGIDIDALTAAIAAPDEQPYKIVLKSGEIKLGDTKVHIYDEDGHNGLKGRVKTETLAQATELGVKAVATEFEVDYKGNDPKKLKEAVIAKLNIPVDEKVKEKDRDIETMRTNWNTEKAAREQAEIKYKEREELDRDISFFPDNRIKTFKDKTLRTELKEEGITFGEHEGKPAVFVNGEVKKNADLTLIDPKTFAADHFKTKGWIQADATPLAPGKKTFDVADKGSKGQSNFDHKSTYDRILQANGGKWTDKAQAQYTDAMLAGNPAAATA